MVAFFGFLLTSVLGAGITSYYQEMNNQRKDKELKTEVAKFRGEETLKSTSENLYCITDGIGYIVDIVIS